jgi:hypothetical protein
MTVKISVEEEYHVPDNIFTHIVNTLIRKYIGIFDEYGSHIDWNTIF